MPHSFLTFVPDSLGQLSAPGIGTFYLKYPVNFRLEFTHHALLADEYEQTHAGNGQQQDVRHGVHVDAGVNFVGQSVGESHSILVISRDGLILVRENTIVRSIVLSIFAYSVSNAFRNVGESYGIIVTQVDCIGVSSCALSEFWDRAHYPRYSIIRGES